MCRWTDSASKKLEQYCETIRRSQAVSGADAEEVVEDLRRHVQEEVATQQLTVVTGQDMEQILARLGSPEGFAAMPEPSAPAPRDTTPVPSVGKKPGWWLLILGVLLPLGTIIFEFLSGACAGLFLDPLPTLAHVFLATLVPVVNLLIWLVLRENTFRHRPWMGWANGAAVGISLIFTLVFVPLAPFAAASIVMIVGLTCYGIGLAPLAPMFAFICALVLRARLRRAEGNDASLKGFWPGFALGLGVLLVVTLPMMLTNIGLRMAVSEDPEESTRGVRLLRWAGRDEDLLRACYGRAGRSGEIYNWGKPIASDTARFVYYRVHGQPFNSVPPPKLYAGRARWDLMEQEFTWDNDQAGDTVAGRVKGLSVIHSRQDAVIEPEAALAYVEWILEFKNDSPLQRESRAQLVLPPGGVVSRLTLWIDGEEREAAFGGRSQVKTAYKEVVRQRRDPVMVTTCGPDRVLMQCYPVPPNGGKMKVRLGITAPLGLLAVDQGCLRWPVFAERNFTIGEKFQHSLWVESTLPLETTSARLQREAGKKGAYALRGQLAEAELMAPGSIIRARRPADAVHSWTRDTRQENAPFISQTIKEQPVTSPDRVIVVVDGTKGMETCYRGICAALTRLPANIDFALLLARDGCEDFISLQKGTADLYSRVALWKRRSMGGHDNLPALLRAWDLAATAKTGAIVWIHGPQPVALETVEDLRQRFERSGNPPLFLDVETRIGPNCILEKLDGLHAVRALLRSGDLGDDLGRLFGSWSGRNHSFEALRECLPVGPSAPNLPGKEASAHLARLWAAEEVARLNETRHRDEAMRVAANHQLVTAVSGAVVLETQAQYDRAGLQPGPSTSVPSVPEPSSALLLVLGAVLLASRRFRAQRGGLRLPRRVAPRCRKALGR